MEANKYRTSGVIDESTYREINKVLLSRRYIWFTRIAAVVTTIFTVLMVIVRSHFFYFVIFVLLTALLLYWPKWLLKSYLTTAVKRMNETYSSGFIQMETWFTEEGVAIHNLTDGAQLVLRYEVLRRAAETERYFYLSTKSNQFTLVFKDLLTLEQKQSFLPFLKEKCPQITVVK